MHNVQDLNLRAQSCQRNLIQRLLQECFLRQSIEGVKLDASDLRIQGCFRPQSSGAVQIPIVASNWCSKTFYETGKKVFLIATKSCSLGPLPMSVISMLSLHELNGSEIPYSGTVFWIHGHHSLSWDYDSGIRNSSFST